MTNILLVIPNLGSGGAQRVFRQQYDFYSQHFNLVACVFNKDNLVQADSNLNLISLNVPAGDNLITKAVYFVQRISRLRAIKRKHKITHSISHLEGADYVNILSVRTEKVICWIHGTKKFDNEISGLLGWIRRRVLIPNLYIRSDHLICVSEGIRKELQRDYKFKPELLAVIHNGFNADEILQQAKNQVNFPHNQLPVLITHGRLAHQKNLLALISIFAKVKRNLKCRLVIIGDGELRDRLVDQATSLGLVSYKRWQGDLLSPEYDVYFMGYQSNPYPLLTRGSLYLMTSLWEGFPLALCEAMICGVPVMASDCFTGPREILASELNTKQPTAIPIVTTNGMLMPLANSLASIDFWSDEICKLLNDESKRTLMAQNANLRSKDFDLTRIHKKWLALIND